MALKVISLVAITRKKAHFGSGISFILKRIFSFEQNKLINKYQHEKFYF